MEAIMRFAYGLTAVVCGLLLATAAQAQLGGIPGGLGGGASGGASGAAGAGSPGAAADLTTRAGIRVGGGRQVGAGFNSVRLGASAGGRGNAGMSRGGVSLSGSGDLSAEARRGRRNEQPPAQNEGQPPADEPQSNPSRPLPALSRAALQADLMLAHRLADVDRLRDVALSRGDAQMLLRCDQLEQEARYQHHVQVEQALATDENLPADATLTAEGEIQGEISGRAQAATNRARRQARAANQFGKQVAEQAIQHGNGAVRQTSAGLELGASAQAPGLAGQAAGEVGADFGTGGSSPPPSNQPPQNAPQAQPRQPYPPTAKGDDRPSSGKQPR
jgi:hypothetical protein